MLYQGGREAYTDVRSLISGHGHTVHRTSEALANGQTRDLAPCHRSRNKTTAADDEDTRAGS